MPLDDDDVEQLLEVLGEKDDEVVRLTEAIKRAIQGLYRATHTSDVEKVRGELQDALKGDT